MLRHYTPERTAFSLIVKPVFFLIPVTWRIYGRGVLVTRSLRNCSLSGELGHTSLLRRATKMHVYLLGHKGREEGHGRVGHEAT